MLRFTKITSGSYEAINLRYTIRIEKQDISKEWVLSIKDDDNRDCLADTNYSTHSKKSNCIEYANNYINN
tara:strand:- start:393 stop:602 length:210 start_codon:yes stop_codon:yes gene_type:complete